MNFKALLATLHVAARRPLAGLKACATRGRRRFRNLLVFAFACSACSGSGGIGAVSCGGSGSPAAAAPAGSSSARVAIRQLPAIDLHALLTQRQTLAADEFGGRAAGTHGEETPVA